MTRKKRNWLIAISVLITAGLVALVVTARALSKRIEPYIQQQAILYLQQRFDSEVELSALRVGLPKISPLRLLFKGTSGLMARVEGEGLSLRHKGRRDVPPMFVMKRFSFDVDIGKLFDAQKTVQMVTIDGMQINIPPKGERPDLGSSARSGSSEAPGEHGPTVLIEAAVITNSLLVILPRDRKKIPLEFGLHRLKLQSVGTGVAMQYDATLTNAKPPGEIYSKGRFGPWVGEEPGDTPLGGEYTFDDADLSVFKGIAGILDSKGTFEGTLSSISVHGEASVPKFRLKSSGNVVPLVTRFDVLVDGTNGNTILKPVLGTLGRTRFTTSGGVIKHEADAHRTISLNVTVPNGNIRDLLTLAMKGPSFMEGRINLKTKIDIPPLSGRVQEKLLLDGSFELLQAKFLQSKIQDQIDTLSRRGQGQPKNEQIDEVVSQMAGSFKLEDQVIAFNALSFAVEGAGVDLRGSYDLDQDVLDFHGALRLQAKVSQTMSGWKRWALKPVDPFFSKDGAGTLLKIKIEGSAKEPKMGLDRGSKKTRSTP